MRIGTALLIALAAGCSTSSGAGGQVDAGDFAISVRADKSTVAAGESLKIIVTATNKSAASRTLDFSSGCQTDFEFADSDGRVAATSQRMCAQMLTQKILQPSESLSETHVWTRTPSEPNQLRPGRYHLRGVLLAVGNGVRSEGVLVVIQ